MGGTWREAYPSLARVDLPDDWELAQLYAEQVAAFKELLVCEVPYARPEQKLRGSVGALGGLGGFKDARRVRESEDIERHVAAAAGVAFPGQVERGGYVPAADLIAAVDECVRRGRKAPQWRNGQAGALKGIAHALQPVTADLRRRVQVPPGVAAVAGDVHVAFLCAACDAMAWPDADLPYRMLTGMPVLGVIEDTGLYRPISHDCTVAEFRARFEATMAENDLWMEELVALVERRGRRLQATDRWAAEEIERVTHGETKDGLLGEPMTLEQIRARHGSRARPLPRFHVPKGTETVRCIDDGKISGSNEATRMPETIAPPTFELPAHVSALFSDSAKRRGVAPPELAIGLDDIFAAYRKVPSSQPEFTTVAYWSVAHQRVEFTEVFGHPFGLLASVVNFHRVPTLLCAVARRVFAVPVDHFFDDYICVEPAFGRGSAQDALKAVHDIVRFGLAPKKRKDSAQTNVELGVVCDVSRAASDGIVSFAPTESRVEGVLGSLRRARAANRLTPAEAATVFGKLGFTLAAAYGRVGRAATQPLIQRCHRDVDFAFGVALQRMHEFLERLLPALPVLEVDVSAEHGVVEPHVCIYTDASFERDGTDGIGVAVLDPVSGERLYAAGVCPEWLRAALVPGRKTYIAQLEAIAVVAAYTTFGHLLRGRRVYHFVDNTVALSAAIHGYANQPDMADASNALHCATCGLRVDLWLEWVASAANLADVPSRPNKDRAVLDRLGMAPVRLVFPSPEEWADPSLLLRRAYAPPEAI